MAVKIHLRYDVIYARIPDGATMVRDLQPEGRWICGEDCEEFRAGSRMNGYNLLHSAKVMPEGIRYSCRETEIVLRDGKWISTKTGRATNPAYNET